MMNNYMQSRINKLRLYLFNIIEELKTGSFQINANMLSNEINNYSLDKIPVEPQTRKWITGEQINRDVFSFRSRLAYSQDTITNLTNMGFFEEFEKLILDNNRKGVLPNIDGIQEIACLNCGTLINTTTNTATFDIQIQITYLVQDEKGEVSL